MDEGGVVLQRIIAVLSELVLKKVEPSRAAWRRSCRDSTAAAAHERLWFASPRDTSLALAAAPRLLSGTIRRALAASTQRLPASFQVLRLPEAEAAATTQLAAADSLHHMLCTAIGELQALSENQQGRSPEEALRILSRLFPAVAPESTGNPPTVRAADWAGVLRYFNQQACPALVAAASRIQPPNRRWLVAGAAVLGAIVAGSWVASHGTELRQWARIAIESVLQFWNRHLSEPLRAIRDELWVVPGQSPAHAKAVATLEQSQASYQRMIDAFAIQANTGRNIEAVMHRYEGEMQHPLKSVMFGHLGQAALIQVQGLKVETESALEAIERMLAANKLNMQLLATIPAIVALNVALWLIGDATPHLELRRSKLSMLMRLELADVQQRLGVSATTSAVADPAGANLTPAENGEIVLRVRTLLALHRQVAALSESLNRRTVVSWLPPLPTAARAQVAQVAMREQTSFAQDMAQIASPGLAVAQRHTVAQRVGWAYPAFNL
eukprot:TRINITY_DN15328_c0_g1_i1.p1 TRINITY_DN15328_c0_g1~~TRINITY_DN15328_c0_g1_i1.p1  ORF type:complete len:498 (+),score=79.82 TRINITY_DN15328_c0_g1_i1:78-1571(+)